MNSPTHPDVYTHGHHESVLRSHRWRTAENSAGVPAAGPGPGHPAARRGLRPGHVTIDLAARLEPGEVVGVDTLRRRVVEIAQKAAADAGADNVTFQVADAYELPFPDDAFDVVHAHQVLQHLTDPVAALREMRRVTRPGGVVARPRRRLLGHDLVPASRPAWTSGSRSTTRSRRPTGPSANAGRQLLSWVREAGFDPDGIVPSAGVWCYATPEDRTWWAGLWADRVRRLELRRAGHRARPRRRGRARAARRRVARVGQAARRLVRGAARRGAGPRLN